MIKNKAFHFNCSFSYFLNVCFFMVTLLLLSSVSFADVLDSSYEIALTKAVSRIESADYEGAIGILNDILKNRPDDEKALLYLGIALNRSGSRDAEGVLKKALRVNPKNPRTNLELGITYFSRNLTDESKDYFENTITLAPDTELARKAKEYLRTIQQKGALKPWDLNISGGLQYDSNVVLDSGENPLPKGISGKSDWRAVLYLQGRYRIVPFDQAEISAGYSFYQSLHFSLSSFNVTDNLLDLSASYRISPIIDVKGIYSFDYALVGGDPYVHAYTLSPVITISEGKGYSTVLQYQYRNSHFMNTDHLEDNSDRTGSNNLISITQHIPLSSAVVLKLGYGYDKDTTREAFWNYKGNKGTAELQATFPYSIYADLYVEYYRKKYEEEYPGTDEERDDKVTTLTLTLTKTLSKMFSVTLGQTYVRNKSNIDVFDYDRAITGLFLNVRF